MIKNQKQASITRDKLNQLLKAKGEYKETGDSLKDKFTLDSLNSLIKDLEFDLKEYDSLVEGNFHCLKANSLDDIANVLIAARLAQKLSQRDLAEIVDLKEQQIQRYESTDYETASWTRILEISDALGLKFYFEKIIMINTAHEEVFEYPDGVTKELAEAATRNVKKTGLLSFS